MLWYILGGGGFYVGGEKFQSPNVGMSLSSKETRIFKYIQGGGLKFYRSANDVIHCPGNEDGFLLPEYFEKIVEL